MPLTNLTQHPGDTERISGPELADRLFPIRVTGGQRTEVLRLTADDDGANAVAIQNGTTGNPPVIQVGGETNAGLTVQANGTGTLTLGQAGDTLLGDTTERTMRPHTTAKMNLGSTSYRFNRAWCHIVDAIDSANLPYSEDDVTNPPTAAELDAAFPNAEQGFIGAVNDNGAGTNYYVCAYDGTNWWTVAATKAT